jgi:prepilin-type N-terminal cleavage/methylation domain-containing protein
MMPPINGMQARAAATFEGKPVDVDLALGSGDAFGTGGIGSSGSGMVQLHKLPLALSSELPRSAVPYSCFRLRRKSITCIDPSMPKTFSRGFTLAELMIVIATIAILAAFAYPAFISVQERARVTQDMNNLRQIGLGTQRYLTDNDDVLFATATTWMSQLHPKYLPSWNVFRSPFDKRPALEDDTNSPVSYGLNSSITNKMDSSKITNPSIFILFAPSQATGNSVVFQGTAATSVTVSKTGPATGGTHNLRKRIDALFADLHAENMFWTVFANSPLGSDPSTTQRWSP